MKKTADSYTNQLENRLEEHKKKVNYSQEFIQSLCEEFRKNNYIEPFNYEKYNVKRGLRNADGTGVMAGVTKIGNVEGYVIRDASDRSAGQLIYRGIDINTDRRVHVRKPLPFEETIICCFGALPPLEQLNVFKQSSPSGARCRTLYGGHVNQAPSRDVMNKLARSVLAFIPMNHS